MNILRRPCPNFTEGRSGYRPEIIVIHISEGTLSSLDSWFGNKKAGSSAHYAIGKKGEVYQYVLEKDTAWHVGVVCSPTFKLYKPGINPNNYTIGIEHEGHPTDVWTNEMKKTSAELIEGICRFWNIPLDRDHVIGHYQIRATKPNCPAVNKSIIDELITLAKEYVLPPTTTKVEEAIKLLEQALNILKQK